MDTDLSRLTDTLPALVWTTTANGAGGFVSARWRDYAGLALEQARAASWTSIIYPDGAPAVRAGGLYDPSASTSSDAPVQA
jgi:hypothetical protein